MLADHAGDVLYSDLPPADRAHWFSLVSHTQSYKAMATQSTGETWLTIPTSYLVCEDDRATPKFLQDAMVGMMSHMGGRVMEQRIKSGHFPFLSHVEETAGWVRRVAGEEV